MDKGARSPGAGGRDCRQHYFRGEYRVHRVGRVDQTRDRRAHRRGTGTKPRYAGTAEKAHCRSRLDRPGTDRSAGKPGRCHGDRPTTVVAANKRQTHTAPVAVTDKKQTVIPSNATGGMSAEVRTQSTAIGVKRGDDHRTADYLARLAAAIRKRLFYPPAALRRGLEGKVLARLRLGPAGDALNCDIAKSSGHALLDRAALNLIRLAQPYDPPPLAQGARELTIVIPILYDLKNR